MSTVLVLDHDHAILRYPRAEWWNEAGKPPFPREGDVVTVANKRRGQQSSWRVVRVDFMDDEVSSTAVPLPRASYDAALPGVGAAGALLGLP